MSREIREVDVVAAVIRRGGRYLVCQRMENGAFPLKWEFAGGKVEAGEDALAALRRELKEELGIEVDRAEEILQQSHTYQDQLRVNLKFYLVDRFAGDVMNKVFQGIRWVEAKELKELDFLEANQPLIRKLNRED